MSGAFNILYRQLIKFYPAAFQNEFGEEMQFVFSQALSSRKNTLERAVFFLKELFDLPAALLGQHLAAGFHRQGAPRMDNNGPVQPSSQHEAFLGALPFLMYGLICMLVKLALPLSAEFALWLAFYLITLIWLVIGWVKGFPRWSYASLGWSITIALMWGGAPLALLFPAIVVALVWTHSISPIKKFFLGILNDWTNLSFALVTLPAWFILSYMGNNHPYVMLFMLGSTLAVSLGAYLYLRSPNMANGIISLLGSWVAAFTLLSISENAWNNAGNYPSLAATASWYLMILRWFASLGMLAILLFGPAILSLFRPGKHPQSL